MLIGRDLAWYPLFRDETPTWDDDAWLDQCEEMNYWIQDGHYDEFMVPNLNLSRTRETTYDLSQDKGAQAMVSGSAFKAWFR